MKQLVFAAVGILLIACNVWYLLNFNRMFLYRGMPDVIAPFQYLGVEDKDGARGAAMAQMLAARLASLQAEVMQAEKALGEVVPAAVDRSTGVVLPPPPDRARPIELKAGVISAPKLELKVSGVDFSGVFSWLYRSTTEGRAIRVTVHSPAGAQKYTVSANLETPGVSDLWLTEVEPNDVAVVEQLAIDVLRKENERVNRIPEAAGLDRKEFASLISALRKTAELNFKLRHGVDPTRSEYNEVVSELEPVLARTPRWSLLIELAAKSAENGRDLGRALDLYRRLSSLLDESIGGDEPSKQQLEQRASIESHIARLSRSVGPKAPPKSIAARVAASAVAAEYPWSLIGVPRNAVAKGAPRVAVLGGVPTPVQLRAIGKPLRILKDAEAMADQQPSEGDRSMREHTGSAALVVREVAPNATLIFDRMPSRFGGGSVAEAVASLNRILDSKPDVVLIPLLLEKMASDPGSDAELTAALVRAADAALLVVSAGNRGPAEPAQFDGRAELKGRLLVADAVDSTGARAAFASGSDEVMWAPGVDIPIAAVDQQGRLIRQTASGTTYSAALAAGLAARVKGEKVLLKPKSLIDLLRRTSKAIAQNGPKVLQLDAALKDPAN